jgi:hypothetical protein
MSIPESQLKHLGFVLSQGGVTLEGVGNASGGEWVGDTLAHALTTGPVFAMGVVVSLDTRQEPPSFETTTWCETKKVVQG